MGPAAYILGGAVAIGGLILIVKAKQKQQSKSACEQACGNDASCIALCSIGSSVAGGVVGALTPGRSNTQVLDDEAKKNDALNGPIKTRTRKLPDPYVPASKDDLPEVPFGLGGNAVEYESGCVPVWNAPGNEKCAPGTVDMWGEELRKVVDDQDLGADKHSLARAARLTPDSPLPPVVNVFDRHVMRSGSFDPQMPDPTTQGPQHNADGTNTWLVAGVEITCPSGQCPELADGSHFAWPPRCAPVPELIQGGGASPAVGQVINGCPVPPGWTWVPPGTKVNDGRGGTTTTTTWALDRLRAGQTPNPGTAPGGPCASSSAGASSGSNIHPAEALSHFA